jgi:hypothetical protein
VLEEITGVVKDIPTATDAPPVLAVYQFMVPALAVAPKLTVPGPHLEFGDVPVIMGLVVTVAVTADLAGVVHPVFVASTQYVVVEEIDGVVNDVPVFIDAPPVLAVYQFIVPALAVAAKLTVPVLHLEADVILIIVGIVFTVAATEDRVAVVHPLLVASTK